MNGHRAGLLDMGLACGQCIGKFAKAPRALKEPECCSISSLKMMDAAGMPKSARSASSNGVRLT
jgi:hypothetical protein